MYQLQVTIILYVLFILLLAYCFESFFLNKNKSVVGASLVLVATYLYAVVIMYSQVYS